MPCKIKTKTRWNKTDETLEHKHGLVDKYERVPRGWHPIGQKKGHKRK